MEFLNRLDQEQEQNALLIARKAKEMGVDPRLAVALAFQESSLRHGKTGEAGEIGIMQVRPTTAKMIGFDPKELNNPEQNIQIGLTYLKQGMDRYKDPVLAAAGYNAGMDHPFFADPSKELPKSTMSYLESIKGLGAFTEAPPASTQEAAPTSPSGTVTVSDQDFQMDKARALVGGAGAIAGAVGAKSLDLLSEYGKGRAADKQAVRDIAGILKNVTAAAPTSGPVGGPVGGPAGPVSSGLPPAQGPLSNAPAGGRMTQNWMRSQDAAGAYELEAQKARDLKEAHQMKRAAMAAEDKIRAIAPEMRQVPERAGLFLPESAGRGPRGAPNVPIPPAAPPAAPPPPGALQRIGSAVSKIPGAVLGSPMVSGALGGLGATEMGMQAAERYSADDPIGAAIAGVGAAGGALAMAPHPAAKIVGGGLAAASPLTLYLYDKLKTKPYPEPLGIREAYIYGPSR